MDDLTRFALACAGLLALVWILQRLPRLIAWLLALAVVLLITGDSEARVLTVTADYGGELYGAAARVDSLIAHRDVSVRIEGECDSACTMIVAMPAQRICVGPGALMGFHQAFSLLDRFDPTHRTMSPEGTAVLMRHYPARLRAWIAAQGGLTTDILVLQGAAMRSIFRACR